MKALYIEQGSAEWLAARCGMVTASRVSDVMAYNRDGTESAKRRNYKAEIIAEILTGTTADHYVSREMEFGTANEPLARTAYEIDKEIMVDQVGFLHHPSIERAGASPDGLLGLYGGLEIKIPTSANFLKWIEEGTVPMEHMDQIQFNMACAGEERVWWDFMAFDPRMPKRYQKFIAQADRDDGRIAELEDGVRLFLKEVDAAIAALEARFPALPEPLASVIDDLPYIGITDEEISAVFPQWKGTAQ